MAFSSFNIRGPDSTSEYSGLRTLNVVRYSALGMQYLKAFKLFYKQCLDILVNECLMRMKLKFTFKFVKINTLLYLSGLICTLNAIQCILLTM